MSIQANLLYNLWGSEKFYDEDDEVYKRRAYSPSTSDVSNVIPEDYRENFAAAIRLSYDLRQFNAGNIALGYRLRGSQANMMYIEQGADGHDHLTDQLGERNSQRVHLEYTLPSFQALNGFAAGFISGVNLLLYNDGLHKPWSEGNIQYHFNPWLDYNLRNIGLNARVWVYANMFYNTKEKIVRGDHESAFLLERAGIRVETGQITPEIRSVEVFAGFDNIWDRNYFYNSYLATVRMINNLNIQGGFMFRIAHSGVEAHDNPFGFFAGFNQRLNILSRPILYSQFLWNMNPYKGTTDGIHVYDLDGYLLGGGGRYSYSGRSAARIGLRWEF
jgi:hypothetical protein